MISERLFKAGWPAAFHSVPTRPSQLTNSLTIKGGIKLFYHILHQVIRTKRTPPFEYRQIINQTSKLDGCVPGH